MSISISVGCSDENLAALYRDPFVMRVCDDDMEMAPVSHPLASYLSAWINGVFSGAFLVIRFSDREFEIHSLLMRRATMASRDLGRMALCWVFSHDKVARVTAYVREDILTSVNHCLRLGFKKEGFRREAVVFGGKLMGLHILGLTRSDWGVK